MSRLIIHHHLGLGDHFICNGLVHAIYQKLSLSEIFVPTKEHNMCSVRDLYRAYPHVKIIELPKIEYENEDRFIIERSRTEEIPLLKISYCGAKHEFFDASFYDQIGIPLQSSWDDFYAPTQTGKSAALFQSVTKGQPYCLVSDTGSIGKFKLKISTQLPIVHIDPTQSDSLLDWIEIIKNADEIHCIDSSVIHLADRLNLRTHQLVYHNIGRGAKFHLRKKWTLQEYK